ncbi:hypothetical protein [Anaerorhabdus sp.]|uniref:hypothetical protein n=1 Tax=Anaerorhabdus sp. TaxID=1872524 RepID=UPI002FC91D6C
MGVVIKAFNYLNVVSEVMCLVSKDYPDTNISNFASFNTNPTTGIVIKAKMSDPDLRHALIQYFNTQCLKVDNSNTVTKNCYEVLNEVNESISFNKLSLGRKIQTYSYHIAPVSCVSRGIFINSDTTIIHPGNAKTVTFQFNTKTITVDGKIAYELKTADPLVAIIDGQYYDGYGELKVSWEFLFDDRIVEQFTQKTAELYYKKVSDGVYSKIIVDGNFYTFNNLENTDYNFYVKVVADDDQVSTSTVMTTTNEDVIGSVVALSPSNTIEVGSVLFKWQYKNDYGSPQLAFDISTSEDGNEWKIIANHVESSETQYLLEVYNKNVYWKVRSYNLNDKPSEWSNVLYFVNNAKQQPPVSIHAKHAGRPLIEWECDGQIAYELETNGYKSGVIYSKNRYHFLNEYLKNGSHLIRIRSYNSYGNQSDWSEFEYIQNMVVDRHPNAKIEKLMYGIKITIQPDPLFTKYYVYRNGLCISKTNNETIDYFVQGECNYTIRGITADDLFADTDIGADYDFKGAQLITLDRVVIDVDKRLDSKPTRKVSVNIDCESKSYLGKKKLVHSIGTLVQRTFNVTCQSDYVPLGIVCFYRDEQQSAFVICNGNSVEYFNYGNETQFTLEETDFDEVVEYDI